MSEVTPPISSPVALLGWAVAGLLAVAGMLFRTLEKSREAALSDLKAAHAAEKASLMAQLDESRRREAERRDERDKLGRLYDEERQKRSWDAESMVRRMTVEQIRSFEHIDEESTSVRTAVSIAQAAITPPELAPSEERRLARYAKGDALTTPPEAPRPRLPSRSR